MTGGPVVIVDDHALVAGALVMALRSGGIEATALLPAEFLPRVDVPAAPGALVLLDLDLGDGLDGVDLVPRLRRSGWRVVLVTGSTDEDRIAAGIAAGALGRVRKSAPFPELVAAATRAAEGRPLIGDDERRRIEATASVRSQERRLVRDRWDRLTPRELQIVDRIAAGRRPAAIAEEFVVSVATVRTQIRSILAKLEVTSQLEVSALAQARKG
ncbi:response regulator transcription factor [Pseudonocardia abyssalis]|uniref:Response regulator transcription factor n=1 Tax=Pseudonocardia abyssalis TaxID=2792008 RepID=A0ABS6V1Q7_9PSEU|nr:response regulator [Pseudonocardia abyssalis]MBW0117373.1 response regulator transcription factor [Pseudonocardia abyssalis]MBW0137924.1 response regulator transcription factor [Pseudonocardia abyssalis]